MSSGSSQSIGKVYRRLLRYSLKYWVGFAVGFGAMLITAATETAFPALMKPLLDNGFGQPSEGFNIWWAPVIVVVIFVVRGISSFTSTYSIQWISNNVLRDLRSEIFGKIVSFPCSRFDQTSSGELISKLVSEAQIMLLAATNVITILVRDSLVLLGLLGWMIWLNWKLTLVILLLAPLLALMSLYFSRRMRGISHRYLHFIGQLTKIVEEAISAQKVIKIFNGRNAEQAKFDVANNAYRGQAMRLAVASSLQSPISQFIAAIGVAVVITLALFQSRAGEATVGDFVSFITAMLMMFSPLKHLASINGQLQQGLAASQNVFSMLDQPSEVETGDKLIERAAGDIRFESVTLTYPSRSEPALSGVSIHIPAGSTCAVVGPSGGGKTTLAHAIPRLYEINQGRITIDEIDTRSIRLDSLRQQISLVTQDITLFNDSILNNVRYGRPTATDAEVLNAISSAALLDFVESLPLGENTVIGDNGVQLSGGQRQRLAIARSFLKDAPIVIFDEATSALDNESELLIQEAIHRLRLGRTTIIVAHRLSTVEAADSIVVMKQGRVVQSGTHNLLISSPGLYQDLYRRSTDTAEAAA
ncbi:MdlB ABC-type multidrug transport system, ATPase and permease components [Burkholderiales bacterium]